MIRTCARLLVAVMLLGCAANPAPTTGGKEIGAGSNGQIEVRSPASTPAKAQKPGATPTKNEQATPGRPSLGSSPEVRLGLSVELLNSTGTATPVAADRVFHSGERIRLHLRGNVSGYVSVLQIDASGGATPLYPGQEDDDAGALASGVDREVPAAPAWLRFDDNPGTERLLVIFARNPGGEVVRSTPEMEQVLARAFEKPGLVGSKALLLERPVDPAHVQTITAVSKNGGPIVVAVALKHE